MWSQSSSRLFSLFLALWWRSSHGCSPVAMGRECMSVHGEHVTRWTRERTSSLSLGILWAWIWDRPIAFSKWSINFLGICSLWMGLPPKQSLLPSGDWQASLVENHPLYHFDLCFACTCLPLFLLGNLMGREGRVLVHLAEQCYDPLECEPIASWANKQALASLFIKLNSNPFASFLAEHQQNHMESPFWDTNF